MSERGSFGPFLFGIIVGAALGALFAPDTGEVTRRQLKKKLRGLRDLAEDKAEDLKALVAGEDDVDEDEADEEAEPAPRSARDELEQRLADARRRRRHARPRDTEEENEPVP